MAGKGDGWGGGGGIGGFPDIPNEVRLVIDFYRRCSSCVSLNRTTLDGVT